MYIHIYIYITIYTHCISVSTSPLKWPFHLGDVLLWSHVQPLGSNPHDLFVEVITSVGSCDHQIPTFQTLHGRSQHLRECGPHCFLPALRIEHAPNAPNWSTGFVFFMLSDHCMHDVLSWFIMYLWSMPLYILSGASKFSAWTDLVVDSKCKVNFVCCFQWLSGLKHIFPQRIPSLGFKPSRRMQRQPWCCCSWPCFAIWCIVQKVRIFGFLISHQLFLWYSG